MTSSKQFLLGLIGYPLGHSLSPLIHTEFFRYFDLSGVYNLYPTSPETLANRITDSVNNGFSGLNVTFPYKKEIIQYCTKLDSIAQNAGAVNTLVIRGDSIEGFNTDIAGIRLLLQNLPTPYFVLGRGGAAVSIVAAFGKDNVVLLDRNTKFTELKNQRIATIVNATPIGWNNNDNFPLEIPPGWNFVDLNYNSSWEWRNNLPNTVVTGEAMLITQAAESFRLWTGFTPPDHLKDEILNIIRKGK